MTRYAGTPETERAVEAGLDWLARHALPEGGWDADGFPERCAPLGPRCAGIGKGQHGEEVPCPFDDALSALALLAFLGQGHGPWVAGDPWGPLVGKALARAERPTDVWSLALAAQALAEAAVLEGKGGYAPAARRLAERLLRARQADGAWAYAAGFRDGSDVPFTTLVVQALVAARDAGVTLPEGLPREVDAWLSGLEADDGRLAYLKDGRAYGYTPTTTNGFSAAMIRSWLEVGLAGPRHRAHAALVRREPPEWRISWREVTVPGQGKQRVQIGHLSLYQWWLGGLALFQAGGDGWTAWWSRARSALLAHQVREGCARGSWPPEGTYERQTGGRVMSTALGVLLLETPYRHRRLAEGATR
jgi:hypothetical protein